VLVSSNLTNVGAISVVSGSNLFSGIILIFTLLRLLSTFIEVPTLDSLVPAIEYLI
jgi:hypothetical protein